MTALNTWLFFVFTVFVMICLLIGAC